MKPYPRLYPGDICAVRGRGLLKWFSSRFIEPRTDRIHHFLIGDYIPWDDDYVILESIGKGIAVGRLSFYNSEDIEIYRVVLSRDSRLSKFNILLRRQVAAEMTRVGRASYDYMLIYKIAVGALQLLATGNMPPWRPEQFPYGRNKAYICTEAANYGWRARGHSIIPPGVLPLPAGFKQALLDRRLKQVYPVK